MALSSACEAMPPLGNSIRLWPPITTAPEGSAMAAPMGMPPAS